MTDDRIETRCPRIAGHAADLAAYLLAAGVPLELVDTDKRTNEMVVISRAPTVGDDDPPDVAQLLADFVPSPPPPSREEQIAAATTLAELKAALLEG